MAVTSTPTGTPATVNTTSLAAVLIVGCGATFLSFLDAAIVTMVFPSIAAAFPSVSTSSLTWVVSGYAVTFAALLAASGRLADTIGHRAVLLTGIAGFTVTSLVCALAPNIEWLIAGRVVQGATAAMLLPSALGVLLTVAGPARAHAIIGAWSATGALAGAIGPAVGAVLVDQWSWRALFVLNLPIGVVLLILGALVLPAGTGRGTGIPDPLGVLALSAGIAALVAAITEGHDWGYSAPITLVLAVLGVAALVWAIIRSARHRTPALEVQLWSRSRCFALSNLVAASVGFSLFAYLLAIPLFFLGSWQVSLLQAAGYVGAGGIAAMVAAALVSRATTPATARWLCAAGLLGNTVGFAVIAGGGLGERPSWAVWSAMAVALGGGVGIAITALSVITAATVPAESSAAGMGLNLTARQTGGAFGVATLSAILTTGSGFLHSVHVLFAVLAVVAAAAAAISLTLLPESIRTETPR